MKKLFSLIVALLLVLTLLVACNPTDPDGNDTPDTPTYLYTDFTADEKAIFTDFIGEVIPFLPANQYEVEYVDGVAPYVEYTVYGIARSDFEGFRNTLLGNGYLYKGIDTVDGCTLYSYEKGNVCLDLCFDYALEADSFFMQGRVYPLASDAGGGDTGNTGGDVGGGDNTGGGDTPGNTKLNNAFTQGEMEMFTSLVGEVIPYLPNDACLVEVSSDEYGTFVYFGTDGNTQEEFDAYRASLVSAGYTLVDSETDEDHDTWYYYEKGNVCVDIVYYLYEGTNYFDSYTYLAIDGGGDVDGGGSTGGDVDGGGNTGGDVGGGGNTGGDVGGGGNTGGDVGGGDNGSTTPSDVDLIVNDGKGLPTGTDGVHNLDFTTATNVKDVHDQGYYLDGCPTEGTPKVLVIPVDFIDVTAVSKGYDLDKLDYAFSSKDGSDGFTSVYEYFLTSSYGKLTLDFTVIDSWFRPANNSTYYANSTDGDGYMNGDQLIIDEALQYLSTIMDLGKFDSDNNDIIDAVVIVHTLDVDSESDFYWAYRYWNYHVDGEGYYYEYDGVSANDYLWASYQFLYESYDEDGNTSYDDTSVLNNYTFIHEFSHVLGADDYYDTAYVNEDGLLAGMDMMDSMFGDHNPYTKFNYGWITSSRLVTTDTSVTLTLSEFGTSGDTIIIANNWDDALGAYQEYYVLMYYTNNGLNAGDDMGYFSRDGIVVYHVNASLYREVYDGETYYDVYNNNTDGSNEYGTADNLIEYVKSANDTYTYVAGDTMSVTYLDNGDALIYNFVVDSIEDGTATITFTKAN